jgi:hypothetical protein
LRPILTPLMLGLFFINPPTMRRYHVQFQTQMSGLMRDFVAYARVQMVSVIRNARLTCQNAAFNLPTYVTRPGVDVLGPRPRYTCGPRRRRPFAGRNIDQLPASVRPRSSSPCRLCSRRCCARGLWPHRRTSLDSTASGGFFRGIEDPGQTILVAESKVAWRVPTRSPAARTCWAAFLEMCSRTSPSARHLRSGHGGPLWRFTRRISRLRPVILVGQDLSFCEGLYYPPGMPIGASSSRAGPLQHDRDEAVGAIARSRARSVA